VLRSTTHLTTDWFQAVNQNREYALVTTIAQKDRQTVRDVLARDLVADVELLLFVQGSGQVSAGAVEAGTQERQSCDETRELLDDLATLSERIQVTVYDVTTDPSRATTYNVRAVPTVIVRRYCVPTDGTDGAADTASDDWLVDNGRDALAITSNAPTVRFLGLPSGYEFSALVADIIDVSKGQTTLKAATRELARAITRPVHLQVFVTPNCPYCPPAARIAHQLAMENPLILAEVIEANEFHDLSERYAVQTVPKTVINDQVEFVGALPEAKVLEAVMEAVRRAG
jgi:thiol-disulfide isomerase/thioredoxin